MRYPTRTSLVHIGLTVLCGTALALAMKTALDDRPTSRPIIRKYTVLVFAAKAGPVAMDRKGTVGCVRAFSMTDPEVVRQFRDFSHDQPIEITFDEDEITRVSLVSRPVNPGKAVSVPLEEMEE